MHRVLPVAILVLASSIAYSQRVQTQAPPTKVDFVRDVQPIFREHCYECHGPAMQKNNFRLDVRRDAMRGGTIVVIGPGNSEGSRLYQRLIGSDFGRQMPPTGALKPAEIAAVKAWIDQGAVWPDAASGETPPLPAEPEATKLIDAIAHGDRAAVAALARGTKGLGGHRGPGGTTPLMAAALDSDLATVALLLDNGANPNARNDAGATALMWAMPDLEKARLLVAHGADVNAKSADGRTALMIACSFGGAKDVVALLLDKGADPSLRVPGSSPLIEATLTGDADVFQELVGHGADMSVSRPLLLFQAVRADCAICLESLLKDASADEVTEAMFRSGPPGLAVSHTDVFLKRGAKADAVDPDGETMLMLVAASETMPVDAARTLIAGGVDVNAVSSHGDTALGLALRHGSTALVDLLRKSGAKDVALTPGPSAAPAPAASARAALDRSLPLVQQSDEAFLRKSGCVSCHNNSLAAMTVATARHAGFTVNEATARQQTTAIGTYLEGWRERALQSMSIPGRADTVGYILAGLAADGFQPTPATDAMARLIMREQTTDGFWRTTAHRPPIESSNIEVTAIAMRSLQVYGPASRRADVDRAVNQAAAWLAHTTPTSIEDRAFQLMGMAWSHASPSAIATAAAGLTALQRADGGWSQLSTLDSDAYATGQALVALLESGARPATDPIVTRGVQFLLRTQYADGSWFVRTRVLPIQPYFDAGFPYGKDQFISAAATNWAARALAMSASAPTAKH
jgi:ankyrin repeat protein